VAVLVLVVRPLAVALSTMRTATAWRDRAFVASLAPRGIVAAATASLFAGRLEAAGQPSDLIVPVVFGVIITAGALYGLGAVPAARLLRVAKPPPRGIVLVGTDPWLLTLAATMAREGANVLVVATGSASDKLIDDGSPRPYGVHAGLLVDLEHRGMLDDMAWAVVATQDREYNLLALPILIDGIGRQGVLLLPENDNEAGKAVDPARWARAPFGPGATHERIEDAFRAGGRLTIVNGNADGAVPENALPMVRLRPDGSLNPCPKTRRVAPGERLIVLEAVRGAVPAQP
jgi:hypothetical protein